MDTRTKIIDPDRAAQIAGELRQAGRRLIVAGGAFDVIQAAHAQFLGGLRINGAIVVAAVYDDASTDGSRPVLAAAARAQLVAALAAVDYVFICPEAELATLAARLGAERVERVPAGRNIIGEILERHK